jgi:uncharacterized protein RhaS with RHS repeats
VIAETGLLCLGQRYYDPGTGRFLNRDPVGYAGGENLYGYAGNNPINEIDPRGTQGVEDTAEMPSDDEDPDDEAYNAARDEAERKEAERLRDIEAFANPHGQPVVSLLPWQPGDPIGEKINGKDPEWFSYNRLEKPETIQVSPAI